MINNNDIVLNCINITGMILLIAATVSDMDRNRFFSHAIPKANTGNTGMFHNFPDELQLTNVMCSMEHTPDTRKSNTNDLACQHQAKDGKQELAKKEVL